VFVTLAIFSVELPAVLDSFAWITGYPDRTRKSG
jgi:hypothetical protein